MTITFSARIKKAAFILAVIFFVFSAGLFYINKVLLPVQARTIVLKLAQDALQRNVTFATLQYSPLRGFVITKLIIADKDDPSKVFLKADSASARMLWLPILKKKIILPSIRLDGAELRLARTGINRWNFSDLIPAPTTSAAPSSAPVDALVTGFTLTNGRVILTDTANAGSFSETFLIPIVQGSLSVQGTATITGAVVIPSAQGRLEFNVSAGLQNKTFRGTIKASNIILDRYLRFLPTTLPVDIHALTLKDAHLTTTLQHNELSLSGNLRLPGIDMSLADGTRVHGDILLNTMTARQTNNDISLESALHLQSVAIETPAGITLRLNNLDIPRLKTRFTGTALLATADMAAKGIDITLANGQKFTTNLDIHTLELTHNAAAWTAHATAEAHEFYAILPDSQAVSGNIIFENMDIRGDTRLIKGLADINANDIKMSTPQGTLTTSIRLPQTRISLSGGKIESALCASFQKVDAAFQGISVKGKTKIDAHIILDPRAAKPFTYAGTLKITGASAENIPSIGAVKDIHGLVTFETNRAQTKDFFLTTLKTPVRLSGEILDLAAGHLNIKAKADQVDLALAAKTVPDMIREYGLSASGTADIGISFDGSLGHLQDGKISGTLRLQDVRAASNTLKQEISALNGIIEYKAPSLSWKNLTATYLGRTWTSHGYMQDFAAPFIKASVKTDNLSADLQALKQGNTIHLDVFTGEYFTSTFNLKGTVLIPDGKMPEIDLTGDFKLSLRELPQMLPAEQAKQIEALKLAGILKIKAAVKGAPQAWQDLTSTVSIETPALYMMGYQISDLAVEARQKEGKIDPLTVSGSPYGGTMHAVTSIALKEKVFPFDTSAKFENVNLELLKKDTPLKQQHLSGLLSTTANLKGVLGDIRHITGQASMTISQGYLWDLEILSKVLGILSSSFQGGDIIITDADAIFKIRDQKVMTDNLTLKSAAVTLAGEGWVDFDQNIDLNISPRLTPGVPGAANSTLTLVNPTAGVVNIRVYNTLTAPKFEHNITAPQLIKKTLQNTVGSFLKIFE